MLINHPEAEIVFINSSSNAGNKITDVHEGLYGETDLVFTDELPLDKIDVLFFCTAHGDTKKFMESHNLPEELKIIDLSMDYRIASPEHALPAKQSMWLIRVALPLVSNWDCSPLPNT